MPVIGLNDAHAAHLLLDIYAQSHDQPDRWVLVDTTTMRRLRLIDRKAARSPLEQVTHLIEFDTGKLLRVRLTAAGRALFSGPLRRLRPVEPHSHKVKRGFARRLKTRLINADLLAQETAREGERRRHRLGH